MALVFARVDCHSHDSIAALARNCVHLADLCPRVVLVDAVCFDHKLQADLLSYVSIPQFFLPVFRHKPLHLFLLLIIVVAGVVGVAGVAGVTGVKVDVAF